MSDETSKHDPHLALSPVEAEFRRLANEWRSATGFLSSAVRMAEHPSYRRIIALGEAVAPLLLKELRNRPDHWFIALCEITGENPVQPESRGNLGRMAEDWLRWGKRKGYL